MGRRQDDLHRSSWLDLFRALGEALLDVVRAELAVVWEHWRLWGRNGLVALALFAVVLFLTFWLSGLLVVALVHGVMAGFELELWQAALVTAAALLLTMTALAGIGWWLASRPENPVAALRRRLDEHRAWLDGNILGERAPRVAEKRLAEGGNDGDTEPADTTGDRPAAEPPPAG